MVWTSSKCRTIQWYTSSGRFWKIWAGKGSWYSELLDVPDTCENARRERDNSQGVFVRVGTVSKLCSLSRVEAYVCEDRCEAHELTDHWDVELLFDAIDGERRMVD